MRPRLTLVFVAVILVVAGIAGAAKPAPVPADRQRAVRDMLQISDLPPIGKWTAGPLDTGPSTARCPLVAGVPVGATADAKRLFSGGGYHALEAVEIKKTAAIVDRDWRSADIPSVLTCLSREIRTGAKAKILAAAQFHPDLHRIASRIIALRFVFQSSVGPARTELEDIFIVFSDRTELQLIVDGTDRTRADADSGASTQLAIEQRLLATIDRKASLH